MSTTIKLGPVQITPQIIDGELRSIGSVRISGTPLRNAANRFLPWFDSYDGTVFRKFRFVGVKQDGQNTVIVAKAVSDPDVMFMERRDSSGDVCVRDRSWDAAPVEADFCIVFAPVEDVLIDGRRFSGFKYWFEYDGADVPIHRIADRQTWEIGGSLDDVTVVCRHLFDLPKKKVSRDTTFSTVGRDHPAGLLPGNLWARWSLLPAFDMQFGKTGVFLAWFDRVSCIRTVIESTKGEDWIRCVDLHYFEQTKSARTNPKTILWCPDVLDDVDAMNLWTRVHDQEHARAAKQFGIQGEEPPPIVGGDNFWRGFRFETSYDRGLETAAEFGADYIFIDPVWEHQQALCEWFESVIHEDKRKGTIYEKFWQQNMCVTLDFEVAAIHGGEKGLKALCDKAAAKGVKVISWMAAHYSPNSALQLDKELGGGNMGMYAAKESSRHPDSGYPASCWTANMNRPVAEKIRRQILGVCERTGLKGFLWDSYSNLGWWQVDYSDGTMRPQFDKMGRLYADLVNAGLYIQPEGVLSFSNHSCCGLHGGNVYAGDLLGYSYNMSIALHYKEPGSDDYQQDNRILKGEAPFGLLFQCFAHKRVPAMAGYHNVPREQWHAPTVAKIKELYRVYKANRQNMKKRTVLKNWAGVLWENEKGDGILFSFKDQKMPRTGDVGGEFVDAATGETAKDGMLKAERVYNARGRCAACGRVGGRATRGEEAGRSRNAQRIGSVA